MHKMIMICCNDWDFKDSIFEKYNLKKMFCSNKVDKNNDLLQKNGQTYFNLLPALFCPIYLITFSKE